MVTITRFLGLDYHQDSVQVCVMDAEGNTLTNRSVPNSWRSIWAVVVGTVSPDAPVAVRASIECCSGAAHLAEELIERAGWSVTLAHPGIVSRMKQNPEKSDWADAHILADLMRLYKRIAYGPSPLSRAQREMIAVVVSKANGCRY